MAGIYELGSVMALNAKGQAVLATNGNLAGIIGILVEKWVWGQPFTYDLTGV